MKRAMLVLLSLCALCPAGSAGADVLFYEPTGPGLIFESATNSSWERGFEGFTLLNESGKFQEVASIFGLGNDELRVQHSDFHHIPATPLPPSWTIMLTGLVGLGFVLYRRKRPDGVEGITGMVAA